MITNYFRVAEIISREVPVHETVFPFEGADLDSTARAYRGALELRSVYPGARVVAWRKPALPGPWEGVGRIGQ